jgi:hypothetical protein
VRVSPAELERKELPGFLSALQLDAHHAEYKTAVENLKATEQAIAAVGRVPVNAAEYGRAAAPPGSARQRRAVARALLWQHRREHE